MHLFALASFLALTPSALSAPHVTDEDYATFIDKTAEFLANADGCAGAGGPGGAPGPNRSEPSGSGGGGASLVDEFNRPNNLGLCGFRIDGFNFNEQGTAVNMTIADKLALGSIATLDACGGPTIRWFPGRDDLPDLVDPDVVNPDGLLPSPRDSYEVVVSKFKHRAIGGAHPRGPFEPAGLLIDLSIFFNPCSGIHAANNPALTSEPFVPFDSTPGVFDNDVFKQVLKGYCPLPFDCEMAEDPAIRPTIKTFAVNQSLFFKAYSMAFEKFLNLTVSPLTHSLSHAVDPKLVASATTNSSAFPFNRVTLKPLAPLPTAPGPATATLCPLGPNAP
ncbi:heme peroxidase [Blyttiomyces helicus]|uniref:Heme peroxidase n=1 Tax=Blyttiomyces helicus TaxID=388810 RepID=A0A4P9WBZ8_9FUNG|nr:heme peroxidase [Blyttiomyces helicus]|eukprot:RKO90024.1 heme peroxidase [Blyttiomyces helicus]